jgi:proteasome assembly chaperone (PAC2) family protein
MSETNEFIEWFERSEAKEVYMIAGWRQWADAGSLSSGLPQYLVEKLGAKRIGRIKPDGFYLFQTPVSQFLFRPVMKFVEGHAESISGSTNDVYWWSKGDKGLAIFIGDEPHLNAERYAESFFALANALNVKRIAATGGIYALVPHDKDRIFTCNFSLPQMKKMLAEYNVEFSNYEGGVSIGSYLNALAEKRGVEYFAMYGFVPIYDFSRLQQNIQNITIEDDHKGWHDAMTRLNYMFKLGIDLTDLEEKSVVLIRSVNEQIEELSKQMPNLPVKEYIAKMTAEFVEKPFVKLDDVWHDALSDIFKDED